MTIELSDDSKPESTRLRRICGEQSPRMEENKGEIVQFIHDSLLIHAVYYGLETARMHLFNVTAC